MKQPPIDEAKERELAKRLEAVTAHRPIVAYQLSLLGDPPMPGKAYTPGVCVQTMCGLPIPLYEDELRQNLALRADSLAASARGERA